MSVNYSVQYTLPQKVSTSILLPDYSDTYSPMLMENKGNTCDKVQLTSLIVLDCRYVVDM